MGTTSFSNISFQQSFADVGQGKGLSTVKDHTRHEWGGAGGVKPSLAATEVSEIKIPAKEERK